MQRYEVMTVVEYEPKDGGKKSRWNRVGSAFVNRDGSITVLLDALPVNGKVILQVPRERDEAAPRGGGRGQRQGGFRGEGYGPEDEEPPF